MLIKYLMSHFFDTTGITARAKAIQHKLGFNPVIYDLLVYKNFSPWALNTLMWIDILEDEYFIKRIETIRKKYPKYPFHMAIYMPLFYETPKETLAFLKKLDDTCKKATGEIFPDDFIKTTQPPNGGPYYDLLNMIAHENKIVPIDLIDPAILTLGLQFSQKPKNIYDLQGITKRDILFLAKFLCSLSDRKHLTKKLISLIDNTELFPLLLVAITPKEPLDTLDFNELLVEKNLDDVEKVIEMYDKNPQETLSLSHLCKT